MGAAESGRGFIIGRLADETRRRVAAVVRSVAGRLAGIRWFGARAAK